MKLDAYIKFQIASKNFSKPITIKYQSKENIWPRQRKTPTVAGLVIYARVDGSFAIWDPTAFHKRASDSSQQLALVLSREQLWDGGDHIEGLIRDWTKWQDKPDKYPFEVFKKVLKRMSPPDIGDLIPGEPVRIKTRFRVFCASMSDVFEDRQDLETERVKLWTLIEKTKCLDWLARRFIWEICTRNLNSQTKLNGSYRRILTGGKR